MQLWTWSPVSASAFSDSVEELCEKIATSQQVESITRVIESNADLTDVMKFSQKFSADASLAKITGIACSANFCNPCLSL